MPGILLSPWGTRFLDPATWWDLREGSVARNGAEGQRGQNGQNGTEAVLAGVALAGPNAGGTLILHATSIVYTDGASSQPQLKGITLGIVYDPNMIVRNTASCGYYGMAAGAWPASGAGISIIWNTVQLGLLTEVCWFDGYCSDGTPGSFRTTPHADGGYFGDDGVPSDLDPIAGYNRLGFNTGGVPIGPGTGETGACCHGGTCTLTAPGACAGGVFYGGPCDPTPCSSTGACCVPGQSCTRMADYECNQYGGAFQGVGSSCSPNPCSRGGTTTLLVWDNPAPSFVGQPVTAEYSVQAQNGGTPTGTVTVTNGIDSCTGTVAEGQCVLSLPPPGACWTCPELGRARGQGRPLPTGAYLLRLATASGVATGSVVLLR